MYNKKTTKLFNYGIRCYLDPEGCVLFLDKFKRGGVLCLRCNKKKSSVLLMNQHNILYSMPFDLKDRCLDLDAIFSDTSATLSVPVKHFSLGQPFA